MAEKDINKQIDNELEDLEVDNDEYERALAVLNSSKGARVRERNNRIKAEKKVKKESTGDSAPESFIEKCKSDIVIPICIAALVLIAVAAVIFFVIPLFDKEQKKGDLGITYGELRTKYSATDMFIQCTLGDYGFDIPEQASAVSADTLAADSVNDASNVVSANFTDLKSKTNLDAYIICMSDKQGGVLNEIDACIAFDETNPYIDSWIMFYFVSYLQVFDPTLTSEAAMNSISTAVTNRGTYYEIGDVSYSVSLINNGSIYYCLQIVPDDLAEDYVDSAAKLAES